MDIMDGYGPPNVFRQIEKLLGDGVNKGSASDLLASPVGNRNLYAEMAKGRVLIIDDNPKIGAQLLKWCAAKDYDVVVARNKKEADTLLKRQEFDTVIRSSEIIVNPKRRKKKELRKNNNFK